jgi:hypothetical protein
MRKKVKIVFLYHLKGQKRFFEVFFKHLYLNLKP